MRTYMYVVHGDVCMCQQAEIFALRTVIGQVDSLVAMFLLGVRLTKDPMAIGSLVSTCRAPNKNMATSESTCTLEPL